MADPERGQAERIEDARVTAAYRGLGAEEPPRALDEAILAASRRPPASAASTLTKRWAVPVSLAAVLVLSITVTLRIQQEQPGIESPAPVADSPAKEMARQAAPAPAPQEKPQLKSELRAKPAPRKEPTPFQSPPPEKSAPRRDAAPATGSSVADASARPGEERIAREAESAARAPAAASAQAMAKRIAAVAAAAPETPEKELERIAGLRREAKHEEADKALAEFRKRYPDYLIAEPMLERVERR